MHFALTHPNMSTRLLYMIAGSLECSCESQVFYTWNEDMTTASNEEGGVFFLVRLFCPLCIYSTRAQSYTRHNAAQVFLLVLA